MVFVQDEGSVFDAPIDFVWDYIFGEGHDGAHTTTRNSKFEKVSDVTFVYAAERNFRGRWAPDRMRISMFRPVAAVTEWLDGVLAGSKFVYVYTPRGDATRIDVYGEFASPTLSGQELTAAALEFLESEYRDDAPAIRTAYRKSRDAPGPAAART